MSPTVTTEAGFRSWAEGHGYGATDGERPLNEGGHGLSVKKPDALLAVDVAEAGRIRDASLHLAAGPTHQLGGRNTPAPLLQRLDGERGR